ncbi:MAG: lysophospholipid acyltransferase family protein [Hyphomonadaceae bacterium]
MTALRSLAYVVWLYGSMALIGVTFAPAALLAREAAIAAARVWARMALWGLRVICGARVRFEGLEHISAAPPQLYASKHQAMLDTITPFAVLKRPAIVLKQELLKMPIFGWFAQRTGMIAIDREGHAKTLKAMLRTARTRLAEGRDIVIFPEGTRQELDAPPDYKIGVAALYRDLGAPCVPVAVSTGLVWSAHGLIRRPGRATIKFLPPIPPGLSREEFMRTLEERIETETAALVARDRQARPAPGAARGARA